MSRITECIRNEVIDRCVAISTVMMILPWDMFFLAPEATDPVRGPSDDGCRWPGDPDLNE